MCHPAVQECTGQSRHICGDQLENLHDACNIVQARKELLKGNFREVHWNWGSLLLGLGVLIAIEGPVNTYLRTGAAVCV